MGRVRLRPDVHMEVAYDDRTPFGSPVGNRPRSSIKDLFGSVYEHVERLGFADLVQAGPALLEEVVRSDRFREACRPAEGGRGSWTVSRDILFPDAGLAPPRRLSFTRSDGAGTLATDVAMDEWPGFHRLVSALSGGGVDGEDGRLGEGGRRLVEGLGRQGLLEQASDEEGVRSRLGECDLTFLGHNTVVVRSATSSLILDPMLFPAKASHPRGYQPLQLRDVGPVDAVLITHSHPDHFAPGSLLRFPPETRIILPRIDRETLLAVDMERRLRELGFTAITVLDWWQATLVGDIEVHALPFYGEQPTDGDVLHPAIRNQGNTYMVRTPTFSAAFLADSGRDGQGDVRQVASRARASLGPTDMVFSGYRGWLAYPVQLLFTSLAPDILFVPPWQWGVRQRIMTTADEAIDVAEEWGARSLVPYADGGAPWYWEIGLGPRLDEEAEEATGFDPFPERVLRAARNRTEMPSGMLGSPVDVLLMRPGDSLVDVPGGGKVVRVEGHAWPYEEHLEPSMAAAPRPGVDGSLRPNVPAAGDAPAGRGDSVPDEVRDLSIVPETLVGAFVEQPFHRHSELRESLLNRSQWFPEPAFLPSFTVRADDLKDVLDEVKEAMGKAGIVKLMFDRGLSNEEFVWLGGQFGTVMVHETTERLQEYVEDRLILNLRQEHPKTGEYDLALVAENYLNLHSEVCTRPLARQPRYIALLCVEPPLPDSGGQTVFVPMEAVHDRLSDRELELLARANFREFPESPPIFSLREGRPVFSFRDFGMGKDILHWRYVGDPDGTDASEVRAAIQALLEAMYDPPLMFGVHWSRDAVVVFDNWFFFHGRTYIRSSEGGPRRHFKNLKVN